MEKIELISTSDHERIAKNAAECGEGDVFSEDAAFFGNFYINGIDEAGWVEINHDATLHVGIMNSQWYYKFANMKRAKAFAEITMDEEMELAKFFTAIAMFKGI